MYFPNNLLVIVKPQTKLKLYTKVYSQLQLLGKLILQMVELYIWSLNMLSMISSIESRSFFIANFGAFMANADMVAFHIMPGLYAFRSD